MQSTNHWRRGIAALSVLFLLAGCGGGGGSTTTADPGADTPPSPPPTSSADSGTVAIMFTDSPTDKFDQAIAEVRRIELLGGSGDALIFEVPDGEAAEEVDLLALRSFTELFAIAEDVPAGDYEKIRLILDGLTLIDLDDVTDDVIEEAEVKLPGNGKVDLNPRGTFFVTPGATLVIELDIDVGKSVKIVGAGNSGKYIFRPVVFVNISEKDAGSKLARVFGTVDSVDAENDTFVLCQQERVSDYRDGDSDSDSDNGNDGKQTCLTVTVDGDTGVFRDDGTWVESPLPLALQAGDPLIAIGNLSVSDEASANDDEDTDSDTDSDSGNAGSGNGNGNGGNGNGGNGDGDSDSGDSDSDSDSDAAYDDDDLTLAAYTLELGELGTFAKLRGTIVTAFDGAVAGENDYEVNVRPDDEDALILAGNIQGGTRVFDKFATELTYEALADGARGHFDGVLTPIDETEKTGLRTALVVLDPDAALDFRSGAIDSVDAETGTLTLLLDDSTTLDVCVAEDARIVLTTLTDEGTTSEDVVLGDLTTDMTAEVFGDDRTSETEACFVAEIVTAELDDRQAPVADAGPDQSVTVEDTVTLDGTGSSDPNDDTLTYSWTLTAPADSGSSAALDDPTSATPSFTADVAGDYLAELTVDDGNGNSDTDTVTVTAEEAASE